jgi:hypothetical protein
MMDYKVKVSRMKSGAFLAAICDDKGTVLKEVYSHYPELNERVNSHLLKRHVELMAWTGKLETEDK